MESIVFAFRFFTNLPFPGRSKWQEETAARALGWLPLTGLWAGVCQYFALWLMQTLGFPRFEALAAIFLIFIELLAGGTLFLDGFSDTCDGLLSRRDRETALRIMKDSRSGAMGVLGLILYFLSKFAFYQELAGLGEFWRLLLFAPILARFAVTLTAWFYPAAKPEGLAQFFKRQQQPGDFLLALVLTVGLAAVLLPSLFWPAGLGATCFIWITGGGISRRLGGHTGDTYGFQSLVCEQMFYLFAAFLAARSWWY